MKLNPITLALLLFVGDAKLTFAANSKTNDVVVFIAKGNEAFLRKDFKIAIDCFSRVLKLDPNNADACYRRGWSQQFMEKYDDAIEDFNKTILICSNNYFLSMAYLGRGNAYFEKNKYEQAIGNYSKAIQINSGLVEAYAGRAQAYSLTKRYDSAVIDFTTAILLNPTNDVLYSSRAGLFCIKTNYLRAMADFDNAIEINPQSSDAYASRGYFFFTIGRYADSVADCTKSIKLNTNSAQAYNNLAWVLTVAPDAEVRDGKKGLEFAKRACELSLWKNAYCLGTLAAAYAETGNFEEAIKWEKRCIAIGLPEKDRRHAREELELFKQGKPYRLEK